jgi:hypothetical protein
MMQFQAAPSTVKETSLTRCMVTVQITVWDRGDEPPQPYTLTIGMADIDELETEWCKEFPAILRRMVAGKFSVHMFDDTPDE